MPDDPHTQLRDAAEKATPGPWIAHGSHVEAGAGRKGFRPSGEYIIVARPTVARLSRGSTYVKDGTTYMRDDGPYPESERRANGEYIAAAQPSVVLALLDRVASADRVARAALDREELWEAFWTKGGSGFDLHAAEDELKAALAEYVAAYPDPVAGG